jgi:hypothetical protein
MTMEAMVERMNQFSRYMQANDSRMRELESNVDSMENVRILAVFVQRRSLGN